MVELTGKDVNKNVKYSLVTATATAHIATVSPGETVLFAPDSDKEYLGIPFMHTLDGDMRENLQDPRIISKDTPWKVENNLTATMVYGWVGSPLSEEEQHENKTEHFDKVLRRLKDGTFLVNLGKILKDVGLG